MVNPAVSLPSGAANTSSQCDAAEHSLTFRPIRACMADIGDVATTALQDMMNDFLQCLREILTPVVDFTFLSARLTASAAWVVALQFAASSFSNQFASLVGANSPPSGDLVHITYAAIGALALALAAIVAAYGNNRRQRRLERFAAAVERALEFFYVGPRGRSLADTHADDDRCRATMHELVRSYLSSRTGSPQEVERLRRRRWERQCP